MKLLCLRQIASTLLLVIAILAVIAASADIDSLVSEVHFFAHIFGCASLAAICLYGHHRLTKTPTTK